ncbi:MAG: hypothetical protein MI919_29050, partial [Holophagales bacterium]|nr:hypothetical protein [Holophagales bacterium]
MNRDPRAVLACEQLRGPPSTIRARVGPTTQASLPDVLAQAGRGFLVAAALLACAPEQGSHTPARPPPDAEKRAGPKEAELSRPEAPFLQLDGGAERRGEIEAGEIHRYHLTLEAGRTTRLLAQRRAADLSLTLRDPGGIPILGISLVDDREIRLELTSAGTGRHSLELQAFSNSASGSYRLAMGDSRSATELDRRRAAMERLFAEAEAFRSRRDRESCERAVALDHEALRIARELGDLRRQADILDHLGWIHRRYLEDRRTALEHYRRSLALFEQLADPRRQ